MCIRDKTGMEQDSGYGVIIGYLRSEDFRGQADRDTRKGEPVYQDVYKRQVKLHLYISLSVFHFRTAFRYKGLGLSQQAFSANEYSCLLYTSRCV